MKSIRELARYLKVSHSTISAHMSRLGITGESQGEGKPTLISEDDCLRIAKSINPVSEPPAIQAVEVVVETTAIETIPQPQYFVPESSFSRELDLQRLKTTIQGFKASNQRFRQAMLGLAIEEGKQLGHEMKAAMLDTTFATFENVGNITSEELGLTQQPSDD